MLSLLVVPFACLLWTHDEQACKPSHLEFLLVYTREMAELLEVSAETGHAGLPNPHESPGRGEGMSHCNQGPESRTVEARKFEHAFLHPQNKERRNTRINHPTSMFQLFGVHCTPSSSLKACNDPFDLRPGYCPPAKTHGSSEKAWCSLIKGSSLPPCSSKLLISSLAWPSNP